MALVHSRIRRVVYCKPNVVNGGLGSYYRIHTLSSLNHRFRVFTGEMLAKEAEGVLDHGEIGRCCSGVVGTKEIREEESAGSSNSTAQTNGNHGEDSGMNGGGP